MCISVAYGQRVPTGAPPGLEALSREMRMLMNMAVCKFPGHAEQLRAWRKPNVGGTLLSYVLIDMEQREMAKVAEAVGGSLMAPEADGVVLWQPSAEQLRRAREVCRVPLAQKRYPQTLAAFLDFAGKRYPGYDWTRRSETPWADVRIATASASRAIFIETRNAAKAKSKGKGKGKGQPLQSSHIREIHTDFATVVAAELEGLVINCEGAIYHFNGIRWVVKRKGVESYLHSLVRRTLQRIFGFRRRVAVAGKARRPSAAH